MRTKVRRSATSATRNDTGCAALERMEDRLLLSVDVLVADRNPATTEVSKSQHNPDIDIGLNGTVVVAWTHTYASSDRDVRFRRYTSDGTPLDDADRHVSVSILLDETGARVAVANDGSFAIAYKTDNGTDTDVFFDVYNATGDFVRREQLYGTESRPQSDIDIAVTPAGSFIAVWTEGGTGTGGGNVLAKVVDSAGNSPTGVIVVAGTSNELEEHPVVAADLFGNFVVAYSVDGYSTAYQRFSSNGASRGARDFIFPNESTIGYDFIRPQIGSAFDGSFVIVNLLRRPSDPDVGYWHLFDGDGNQIAEDHFAASSYTIPSVDMDAYGNFVIGYYGGGSDGNEAYATFFDSFGREGETIRLNNSVTGSQNNTRVAMSNNLLAATYRDFTSDNVEFSLVEQHRGKIGVARPNAGGGLTFYLDSNANLQYDALDATFNFGLAGDLVVVGDWNGDGADDLGVGRPNGTGGLTFYLDSNGNRTFDGADSFFNFGLHGDIVVVGDWNGDGTDDLGVGRGNGLGGLTFYLDSNGSRFFEVTDAAFQFGLVGDVIVVGDWNGDGSDELGVGRPNGTGGLTFFLDSNANKNFDAGQDAVFNYGLQGDRIVVADWNGNGIDGLGVVRPNGTGGQTMYPDVNENSQFELSDALFSFDFGLPDDLLVVGAWAQTPLRT